MDEIVFPSSLTEQILQERFEEKKINKALAIYSELDYNNPEYELDEITYYGDTKSQSRPSFKTHKGSSFGHAYDKDSVAEFKGNFQEFFKNILFTTIENYLAFFPAEGAFRLQIKCYRSIPKNWSDSNKILAELGLIRPESKPDFDNLAKSICDAVNKVIYCDDGQITSATVDKYYSAVPRAEIKIFFRKKRLSPK